MLRIRSTRVSTCWRVSASSFESEVSLGEFSTAAVALDWAAGGSVFLGVSAGDVTVALIFEEADDEALATTGEASPPCRFAITASNTIKPAIPNAIRANKIASPTITHTPDGVFFLG